MSNPTYAKVLEGAKIVKDNQIDFIIAVGGGSVIDCCKIVSAQAKVDQDIWQMEFVDGKLPTEFIPMAAVTTASGTGSGGAVRSDFLPGQKRAVSEHALSGCSFKQLSV